ncbi:hypothetical protein L6164_019681 [Bauhinia variegata]|uniref:Uncharacterized protein n=1 Tax=Bauhinia variegata TaxID=167791 RepID=A0ACB9MSM1_BAUVA|nr:hypothetical protein L6164_019681 [Bauhinia variegata]
MSISMASFSPPTHLSTTSTSSYPKPKLIFKPLTSLSLSPKNPRFLISTLKASADNGVGTSVSAATAVEPPLEQNTQAPSSPAPEKLEESAGTNGSVAAVAEKVEVVSNFQDPRWLGGTWDLKQFQKNGKTDWDAVIDAGEVTNLL